MRLKEWYTPVMKNISAVKPDDLGSFIPPDRDHHTIDLCAVVYGTPFYGQPAYHVLEYRINNILQEDYKFKNYEEAKKFYDKIMK